MAGQAERVPRAQPGVSSARPAPAVSSGSSDSKITEPFSSVSRNNGISFVAKPDVSIHDYIKALTQTTPAECIISASRISNQRIAVYLNKKDAVFSAINNGLTYQNTFIQINPLTLPTTKLTLSNVYPEVPNHVLVKQISSFCKVVSLIKPIPLGFKDRDLSHIMSFRRQVQVIIPPNVTPPDHLNFAHDGSTYRVFLSTDAVKCFECGEFGHVSRVCKKGVTEKGKSDPKHPPKRSTTKQSDSDNAPQIVPTHHDTTNQPAPSNATDHPGPSNATDQPGPSNITDQPGPSNVNPISASNLPAENRPPPNPNPVLHSNNSQAKSPPRNPPSLPPSVWGSPPEPTRLFSDIVKRKQTPLRSSEETSSFTLLDSQTPPRKLMKKVITPVKSNSSNIVSPKPSTPKQPSRSNSVTSTPKSPINSTPKTSNLNSSNPPSSTPSSPNSPHDITASDVTMGNETSDDESVDWASSFPSSQGPLSDKDLLEFLKRVKSRKKPLDVAREFTTNIPGLVRQLRPLRNSPHFSKSTKQRIYKLINKLDDCA